MDCPYELFRGIGHSGTCNKRFNGCGQVAFQGLCLLIQRIGDRIIDVFQVGLCHKLGIEHL